MSQLTVLIYTDDVEFAHMVVARWQTERTVPTFLISSDSSWEKDKQVKYDLAIMGPLTSDDPVEAFKKIDLQGRPGLYVSNRASMGSGSGARIGRWSDVAWAPVSAGVSALP